MTTFNTDPSRYADIVRTFTGSDLLASDALLLGRHGNLAQDWAPFDHTPPAARLVIVGITPGRTQATNALHAFGRALHEGQPLAAALRHAKLTGSFSGQMRGNIVKMLDFIGVHRALGAATCASLFDPSGERVHFTSALRYPVFVNGANYNGTPDMLRTPFLRAMIETCLTEEARALPNALWLPLGPKPAAALRHLIERGVLPADRVLEGMPHPSGASNERIAYFIGQKARADLSVMTRPDRIDTARELLHAQVARLGSA